MQNIDFSSFNTSMHNLLARFEEFPPGCDPDFDMDLSDLEREFAELRLTFDHVEPFPEPSSEEERTP